MTLAPRLLSSSIVGSAALIRVSSSTSPPARGTLKSTRTSTRLPATSASRTLALDPLKAAAGAQAPAVTGARTLPASSTQRFE